MKREPTPAVWGLVAGFCLVTACLLHASQVFLQPLDKVLKLDRTKLIFAGDVIAVSSTNSEYSMFVHYTVSPRESVLGSVSTQAPLYLVYSMPILERRNPDGTYLRFSIESDGSGREFEVKPGESHLFFSYRDNLNPTGTNPVFRVEPVVNTALVRRLLRGDLGTQTVLLEGQPATNLVNVVAHAGWDSLQVQISNLSKQAVELADTDESFALPNGFWTIEVELGSGRRLGPNTRETTDLPVPVSRLVTIPPGGVHTRTLKPTAHLESYQPQPGEKGIVRVRYRNRPYAPGVRADPPALEFSSAPVVCDLAILLGRS